MTRSLINRYLLGAIALLFLYSGCSTEKDTFVHRSYHNTTARYNGYYYADLSLNEGVEKIREEYKEDYSTIIPVFENGDDESAKSAYPEMDRAIEKLSKVIERHSMEINGKQKCKWIDDSYFLLGKAYFYKREYDKADKMFEYVGKKFKKKEIRPKALLWLARTRIEKGQYLKAKNLLTLMEEDDIITEDLEGYYNEVFADLHIHQEQYEKAIKKLDAAVDTKRWLLDRNRKTRLEFIIAQLYEELDNIQGANEHYSKVLQLNPPYEMAFYAKINRALSYEEGMKNTKDIKEQLLKMLKDDKNIDYFDQIYYALAQIELQQGNKKAGIGYLKKSTQAKESDPEQKSKAYLQLADLYFSDRQYELAQKYYDSTSTTIDSEHKRYVDVKEKASSLTDLVNNLNTAEEQDSLLKLASMSEEEQNKIIDKQIQERLAQAEEQQREKERQERLQRQKNAFGGDGSEYTGSTFYFYNQKARSQGFNEFRQRFGERELEDDWRRSERSTGGISKEEKDPAADTLESKLGVITDRSYYRKNIPTNEKERDKAEEKLAQALYDAGVIYREELEDEALAIETFKELIKKVDDPSYTAPTYYQLYRIYLRKEKGNYFSMSKSQGSEYYKEKILEKFPDSEYAKLIRDPGHTKEEEKERRKAEVYYEKTLNAYKGKEYPYTLTLADSALSAHKGWHLPAKFKLLKALSLGRMDSLEACKKILREITAAHSGSTEAERAQAILNKLTNKGGGKEVKKFDPESSPFKEGPEKKHFFCMMIPKGAGNIKRVESGISDFNKEYFRSKELNITSTLIGQKNHLFVVKSFKNKKKGMDYYSTFIQRSSVIGLVNMEQARAFIISQENFGIMFKKKKTKEYNLFFRKVYLDQ